MFTKGTQPIEPKRETEKVDETDRSYEGSENDR